MKIQELLQIGNSKLPRGNAGVLLMHAANITKTELILGELEVSLEAEQRYYEFLNRAEIGEPIEYITNSADFFGHKFYVDSNVLIPRDETELLVEVAIDALSSCSNPTILDIGTGSGCIAISLTLAIPTARIFATDISEPALEIARRNARDLGVADRIEFVRDDVTSDFSLTKHPSANAATLFTKEGFDMVISNPPYITLGDKMVEPTVHQFQPHTALYAADNGLEIYRHIIAKSNLKPNGFLTFEVGYDQAEAVAGLIRATENFRNIQKIPDYAGIDRIILANFSTPKHSRP